MNTSEEQSDADNAKAVKEAAEVFNQAVAKALGLEVEVQVKSTSTLMRPYVEVQVWKRL